jgi:hypothetical protein
MTKKVQTIEEMEKLVKLDLPDERRPPAAVIP